MYLVFVLYQINLMFRICFNIKIKTTHSLHFFAISVFRLTTLCIHSLLVHSLLKVLVSYSLYYIFLALINETFSLKYQIFFSCKCVLSSSFRYFNRVNSFPFKIFSGKRILYETDITLCKIVVHFSYIIKDRFKSAWEWIDC